MLSIDIVLRRPNFTLEAAFEQSARITGIFGPSGAGKSTLMHAIAGLETPDSGRIVLDGQAVLDRAAGVNVAAHRRGVGMVFQDDRLFPHYSVQGNLRYGAAARRTSASGEVARDPRAILDLSAVVDLLALRGVLKRRVSTLSGGERQRVALGRALLSQPRLLLLDEPLSSLDAALKAQILPYLRRVRDAVGMPMLYVSHDLTEMLHITDHLVLMDRGRVLAHGAFGELVHQHAALDALHDRGLVNVLPGTVTARDQAAGVIEVAVAAVAAPAVSPGAAARLRAAVRSEVAVGEAIVLAIGASDVALALARVEGVSIQNQLPGRVARITRHAGRAIVEIDCGCVMLAEVTLRAMESMLLQTGRNVWCLIKSNAIRTAGATEARGPDSTR